MDGIVGQTFMDALYGAPAGLQDSDFSKNLQLIGGDASGITVTVSPVSGQTDAYYVAFTPTKPGEYSLEIETQSGGDAWSGNYAITVVGSQLAGSVIAKGFTKAMFGFTKPDTGDSDFQAFVQEVIAYEAVEVQARLGDDLYGSQDTKIQLLVQRAVVELTTRELWQRRIARILANATITPESRVRPAKSEEESRDRANEYYEKAVALAFSLGGVMPDLAVGAEVSSHFNNNMNPASVVDDFLGMNYDLNELEMIW